MKKIITPLKSSFRCSAHDVMHEGEPWIITGTMGEEDLLVCFKFYEAFVHSRQLQEILPRHVALDPLPFSDGLPIIEDRALYT